MCYVFYDNIILYSLTTAIWEWEGFSWIKNSHLILEGRIRFKLTDAFIRNSMEARKIIALGMCRQFDTTGKLNGRWKVSEYETSKIAMWQMWGFNALWKWVHSMIEVPVFRTRHTKTLRNKGIGHMISMVCRPGISCLLKHLKEMK